MSFRAGWRAGIAKTTKLRLILNCRLEDKQSDAISLTSLRSALTSGFSGNRKLARLVKGCRLLGSDLRAWEVIRERPIVRTRDSLSPVHVPVKSHNRKLTHHPPLWCVDTRLRLS